MRILYVDVDSLRPDHLGCYGYHRNTSPNIDALARQGVRFENCYVSDAPCLPSRTALFSGRNGFHTGVVNHGGSAAQPFIEGPRRGFNDRFSQSAWMRLLCEAGFRTVTVSSFAERHSAWHWYAGFSEILNPGKYGHERAHQVNAIALDWLGRNGREDNWFLHVNYWDPHTPYRTPAEFGNPFGGEPLPEWLTEEVRRRSWESYGPHSAQEPQGFHQQFPREKYPRMPAQLDSMAAAREWLDGYDTGIRYMDEHLGQLLNTLADLGVLDETAVIVSADHGEAQGELNVWGDHHYADSITCRVPLVARWPGLGSEGRVERALHYQYDWAATVVELVGGTVPADWDGQSFAPALRVGRDEGRPYLVTSQNAWTCQRGVRFDNYICIGTYHDGYRPIPPTMLFDLDKDSHEEHNIAAAHPEVVDRAMGMLAEWHREVAVSSQYDVDPMMTVLREGGPFQVRGHLPAYLERLRATGRSHHAETLIALHAAEAKG
jgi:arylsulfatase A-like enzyme